MQALGRESPQNADGATSGCRWRWCHRHQQQWQKETSESDTLKVRTLAVFLLHISWPSSVWDRGPHNHVGSRALSDSVLEIGQLQVGANMSSTHQPSRHWWWWCATTCQESSEQEVLLWAVCVRGECRARPGSSAYCACNPARLVLDHLIESQSKGATAGPLAASLLFSYLPHSVPMGFEIKCFYAGATSISITSWRCSALPDWVHSLDSEVGQLNTPLTLRQAGIFWMIALLRSSWPHWGRPNRALWCLVHHARLTPDSRIWIFGVCLHMCGKRGFPLGRSSWK